MRRDGQDYIVQPVMKALQVLDYVTRQGREVTLTETVKELKLPKTTVFRYLQTLSAASFLDYDVRCDRYRAGPRFRHLAQVDRSLKTLLNIARPELHDLSVRFGETVNLAVHTDNSVVYIDIVDQGRAPRTQARVGQRHPIHSTALGKAIAAYLPDQELEVFCASRLPARTINTVTDGRSFRQQVERVRREGYALDVGENEDGYMCIGVPILGENGRPVAAISLSAPQARLRRARCAEAAGALTDTARRVSKSIHDAA